MRGNKAATGGSVVPGSSRPHFRSSGTGAPGAKPIMASTRSIAVGMTGQAITAIRRIASSSR